ncbi:hypothetical protein [Actibacterium ureilyticum]|uniref:hypothetical protein n=1 Tax=Actibacterium ureilyticum TaxID=1590614 RepID=UPI0011410050|nr:hypothetical protein [Actibacterium ureilyticum]
MRRLAFLAVFLTSTISAPYAHAQVTNEEQGASEDQVRELFDAIRSARRQELFLIDEVSKTCKRVTSGLKQRNSMFFLTSENSQSSELRTNGGGTIRFDPSSSATKECGISNEVDFRITDASEGVWSASFASQYCISAIVYQDCTYVCRESAEVDGKSLKFVLGLSKAELALSEVSAKKSCAQ